MNNVKTIKQMKVNTEQQKLLLDYNKSLNDMRDDDNYNLDLVIQSIKKFVHEVIGMRLENLVETKKYIINYQDMKAIVIHKLNQIGMSGATTYDTFILAQEMLDLPIRDYNAKYYTSPMYAELSNLNNNHAQAIQALWHEVLNTAQTYYQMQAIVQEN